MMAPLIANCQRVHVRCVWTYSSSNREVVATTQRFGLEICHRWLHNGSSNMAVVEVLLLTGFRPDLQSLDGLLQQNHLRLKMYEIKGHKLLFYFDEVSFESSCCRITY